MLYHYRIEVSEGININKKSASEERIARHYWYFKRKKT